MYKHNVALHQYRLAHWWAASRSSWSTSWASWTELLARRGGRALGASRVWRLMGRDHLLRIIIVRMDRSRFFIELQHALQRLIRSIAEGHRSGSCAQGIIITTTIINSKQHHPSAAVFVQEITGPLFSNGQT